MPAIPSATESIRDGGLGNTSPASLMPVVIGFSSLGDPNLFQIFSSPNSLRTDRGYGHGVEHGINILSKPAGKGGGPIAFVGVDPSIAAENSQVLPEWATPGTRGSLTQSGAGPVITIAGNPNMGASLRIEIQTGGAVGTATFRWSLDGGATWLASAVATTGGVIVLSTADIVTGITATFPAGTYVSAETYTWPLTAGGGEIAVSGDANYDCHVRVEVITSGANGVARFRYSLDGFSGDDDQDVTANIRTYSETLLVPSGGTFAIAGLGITLTFDGSPAFVAGDVYTFDTRAPAFNSADLATAFAAVTAALTKWRFVSCVTTKGSGNAAAHAVLAAALQAHLDTLTTTSRYRAAMIPSGHGDTAAEVVTAFTNTNAVRCLVAHGQVRRATAMPFPGFANPVTHSIDCFAARAAGSLPSTDLKRKLSGSHDEVIKIFHDENLSSSQLDDIKVSTMRTYHGSSGFYITQARPKGPAGTDFKLWPLRICMDIACEAAHEAMELEVGRMHRTVTNVLNDVAYPGVIDERDATTIENACETALWAVLGETNVEGLLGHVQDLQVTISRTYNYLSTGVIQYEVAILPHGYTDYIRGTFGYVTQLAEAA
jgi:hypothetical protein